MALNALKIQTADLVGKLVAQLSNRPTNPLSSGGDNLTAQEVKERYDAYGHLLKERFNALVDALVADPAVDTDALANTIQVYLGDPVEEDPMSLSDALAALFATLATKYALPEGGIPATDLAEAVTNAIGEKYVKPGTGIPATDLETAVQTSLGKADTAYQKPSGGIPATDLASAVKAILDSAVSQSEFAPVKALAENADKVLTAANYEAVATMLNAAAKTDYKVGQKILIGAGRVPDLWIYFVHDAAVTYTYTTGLAFQTALENGTLQIGYYALRPLEAKTELEDYPTKTEMNSAISGNIDATLSTTGKSADAKAVGDAIDALIDALVDGVMAVAEATYAESATYAQQADLANQINTNRQIADAEDSCPPTVFGTTGAAADVMSGLMPFPELHGNTIKWNQLSKDPTFATASMWDGTWLTVTNNKATLSGTGSTTQSFSAISTNYIPWTADHIYLIAATITTTHATTATQFRTYDGSTFGHPGAFALEVGTTRKTIVWKYNKSTTTNGRIYFYANLDTVGAGIGLPVGETMTVEDLQIIDLTMDLGITDASYDPKLFLTQYPNTRYSYNAGTLISSKSASLISRKKNQFSGFDEFIRVVPGYEYELSGITAGGYLKEYDANKTLLKTSSEITSTEDITLTAQTVYVKITATTYGNVMFYVLWDTPNEPWEAYSATTVTLPNITLRSKGDVRDVAYQAGGGIRYLGERAYEAGDENDPDVWTDGTNTIYELETPIAITPEENPGWLTGDLENGYLPVHNFGTIEFTQDPAQTVPVPQGYFVKYTVGMVDFLDSLGERARWDAAKVISENYPTTDGTYVQRLVVADGVPTLTWVLAEDTE